MTPFPGLPPILLAPGAINRLGGEVDRLSPEGPVFLLSDAGLASTGLLDSVARHLSGREVVTDAELRGEPRAEDIDRIAMAMRTLRPACVVGVGGGSVLDVAKLAPVVAAGPEPSQTYAMRPSPYPAALAPRVLLPTTAGTGSEVTRTVVFQLACGTKTWAWGKELLAESVILDPNLTLSLPPAATFLSGIDALVHAVEACTGRRRHPVADLLCYEATRRVVKFLPRVLADPGDLGARQGMLWAACLAGAGIDCCGTGLAHALGHALGSLIHLPHGAAVARAMKTTLQWNGPAYDHVSLLLGADLGETFDQLLSLCPVQFPQIELGVDQLVEALVTPENRPMLENNARPVTTEDLTEVARRVLA